MNIISLNTVINLRNINTISLPEVFESFLDVLSPIHVLIVDILFVMLPIHGHCDSLANLGASETDKRASR